MSTPRARTRIFMPAGILAAAALLTAGETSRSAVRAQSVSCRAMTSNGPVQGRLAGGACTYLGIPYAAAPLGELRWRPPQPRAPWGADPYDATLVRQCPQVNAAGAAVGNEDCLVLNVWAPATVPPPGGLPVLVWLHAGAFQAATANNAANDGRRFAEDRHAIVVAANYRLGPMGFLAHAALTAEDPNYPSSGNYGLADQRAALRWVRRDIAAFGGDPNNVTLAGTSAGAESTSLHLVSPASRGLFHRAILQSGNATRRAVTRADAEAQGDALAATLGCLDRQRVLSCLRTATASQVVLALSIGQAQVLEQAGRVQWGPIVDGVEIPDQPRELYRQGRFARMPIIIGTQGEEGWTYTDRSLPAGLDVVQYERIVRTEFGMDGDAVLRMYPADRFASPKDALSHVVGDVEYVCEARRIARVMHHDGAPVYVYSFQYAIPGVTAGRAAHGIESNLLFGNDFAPAPNIGVTVLRPLTAADVAIFDVMSRFWRRFMETGDPNPRGAIHWPSYRPGPFDALVDASRNDRHYVFADHLGVANYLRDQQCNFWEPFFFRSVIGTVPAAAR